MRHILCGLTALLLLGACDLYEPTKMTPHKAELVSERFSESKSLSEVDEAYLRALAAHYERHGDEDVELTITYDPASRTHTAMSASQKAADISEALRRRGVRDIDVAILPVRGGGDQGEFHVAFRTYHAQAPEDCTMLPGIDDQDNAIEHDYQLGCSTESLFARQIARPKHLKGQGRTSHATDARRSSNIVDIYRTGVQNEPLEGQQASDD